MNGESYETGWLELKAVGHEELRRKNIKFEVRPSQISWITVHCEVVPVYFLCAVGDIWFLVHGRHCQQLAQSITVGQLDLISYKTYHQKHAGLPEDLKYLTNKEIPWHTRNMQERNLQF
jgi:hypothetical protein